MEGETDGKMQGKRERVEERGIFLGAPPTPTLTGFIKLTRLSLTCRKSDTNTYKTHMYTHIYTHIYTQTLYTCTHTYTHRQTGWAYGKT